MRGTFMLAMLSLVLAGCATEPWVKPYERELLADPIMSFVSDPAGQKFRQHVYDVLQGSHGAELSQGGGCGCK